MKSIRRGLYEALEKGNPIFWMIAGILSVGFLGILDFITGNEVTFSLFYLLPVILVTWASGQKAGVFISFLSTLTLLVATLAASQIDVHPFTLFLNALIRVGSYIIITYLVAELERSRREERLAARTDFITGAMNARYFNELLQMEIDRIRRYPHPVTVVFIDTDNFKLVNDLFGHKIGDEVLRAIATELKSQLRATDFIARLGGDEFALLLPSTHRAEAEVVVARVHNHLRAEMRRRNLPVTFSMGSVTCLSPPHSAEQLVSMADELMYEVKNSTKDDARFATWRNGIVYGY